MAQPTRFVITVDLSEEEANAVAGRSSVRTAALDALFSALKDTTDQICDNLELIQRDDGALLDGTVRMHTLSTEVRALLASTAWQVRGAWVTATDYEQGDVVVQNDIVYVCMEDHTSGTFATDLAADKWGQVTADQTATATSFSPTTTVLSANVQAAIEEVDTAMRQHRDVYYHGHFHAL